MADLLPCPFCGGTDLSSGGDDKFVGYSCKTCQATGPNHYGSHDWNTRPAAPVEGLDTVASVNISKKLYDHLYSLAGYFIARPPAPDHEFVNVCNGDLRKLNDFINEIGTEELVTRSQAEAIIAAKDAALTKEETNHTSSLEERDRYHDIADKLAQAIADRYQVDIGEHSNINDPWQNALDLLEADNAALTARVRELEADRDSWRRVSERLERDSIRQASRCKVFEQQKEAAVDNWKICASQIEALETQLAAAKKALEKLTLHSNSLALAHVHKTQKNDGIWGALKEARAALEDRP